MKEALAIVTEVIGALSRSGIPHMMVGSFARNFHSFPRSTQDADIVLTLQPGDLDRLMLEAGPAFTLDPQAGFETNTGTFRHTLIHRQSGFTIELFLLSRDPFDQERFARRMFIQFNGASSCVLTAEDLIITKLRWARTKDLDDVRDVLAVQSDGSLNWDYVARWTDVHGTSERLAKIRAALGPSRPV